MQHALAGSPEKKRVPSPVYVKADEQTILDNKYFTIPVSGKELIEKEVEITEEDPQTGVITTTGVRMTWTDSGWVAEPMWQTRLKKDEAGLKVDSTGFEGPVPFYELQ
ncbi:MAG: hypothetical protein EOO01_29730 [Chitinophagaceae bacterium]|nr:MAG: hypothetical protein EOO01_29730 [Chitinophagaceae bacterium]